MGREETEGMKGRRDATRLGRRCGSLLLHSEGNDCLRKCMSYVLRFILGLMRL